LPVTHGQAGARHAGLVPRRTRRCVPFACRPTMGLIATCAMRCEPAIAQLVWKAAMKLPHGRISPSGRRRYRAAGPSQAQCGRKPIRPTPRTSSPSFRRAAPLVALPFSACQWRTNKRSSEVYGIPERMMRSPVTDATRTGRRAAGFARAARRAPDPVRPNCARSLEH
jgi:hypothetical protein